MGDKELTGTAAGKPVDDAERTARREFLKKLSVAGATVPAVSLLLAANSKTASAEEPYGGSGSGSGSG